ncbi:hypothetical protein L1987_74744 [Smallanthus sonchifolius]|uniref:Uncharacterized protein n=1 Tax=Smallanthus sonchifolius TaxID=185202 RepID=A0ACB9A318_9ASTR|nr:hypothetical protein L1987_74744 [Smallanthus sonchifolius]
MKTRIRGHPQSNLKTLLYYAAPNPFLVPQSSSKFPWKLSINSKRFISSFDTYGDLFRYKFTYSYSSRFRLVIEFSCTYKKMNISGLTGRPAKCCFHLHSRGPVLPCKCASVLQEQGKRRDFVRLERRNHWGGSTQRCITKRVSLVKCAMDASFGDARDESSVIFPRININDPYKRLGISKEASEDEIQGARNFLVQKYAGHQPSVDAIEYAHDKIIMQKFYERKNPKINVKKKMREVSQFRVVQAVTSRFRTPTTNFIIKTSIAFVVLAALTILFPTEEGPTLQVAISLFTAIYFIHDRLKSKLRAFLYGVGTFIVSWLLGTFLMMSVIPSILKGPRSLEVTTSLVTYALLWVSSTYLK